MLQANWYFKTAKKHLAIKGDITYQHITTVSVYTKIKGSLHIVQNTFMCSRCLNPVVNRGEERCVYRSVSQLSAFLTVKDNPLVKKGWCTVVM